MSDFTKEPWNISSSVMVVAGGKVIHNGIPLGLGVIDVSFEEAIANANLIARAPSMYKVLKELAEIFPEDSIGELDASDFKDRSHRIWTVAKMAEIVGNKAEGKS